MVGRVGWWVVLSGTSFLQNSEHDSKTNFCFLSLFSLSLFSFLSRDRGIEVVKTRLANDLENRNIYYKNLVDFVSITTPPLTMAHWNEILLVVLGIFGTSSFLWGRTTWHKWYCETLEAAAEDKNRPAAAREEFRVWLQEDIDARMKGLIPYVLWNLSFYVPGSVRSAWKRLAPRSHGGHNSGLADPLRQAEEGQAAPRLSFNIDQRPLLPFPETASQITHHAIPGVARQRVMNTSDFDPTAGD
jgi:hypothetical protein